jgi:hypothetical protein
MQLNLDQVFPISDAPSARLMKLKALCLFRAGVVSAAERTAVERRAEAVLNRAGAQSPQHRPAYRSRAA